MILLPVPSTNNIIGLPFTELLRVDSTNNYAMQLVHKGLAQHGSVWFAHEQTHGKGQVGRLWYTNPGENIIMSALLNTNELLVSTQFVLNMAIALAVYDFFNNYAVNETSIKWPNDLYWRDRKAGGILIQNIIKGMEWQWAIAGIGININQTEFDMKLNNPVSLKQITGRHYTPVTLAKELCVCIEKRFQQVKEDSNSILAAYNTVLYKKNEKVKLKKENAVFECFIKEVNINGQLVTLNGTEQTFNSTEVQWVI